MLMVINFDIPMSRALPQKYCEYLVKLVPEPEHWGSCLKLLHLTVEYSSLGLEISPFLKKVNKLILRSPIHISKF